jgi:Tfp pilus assembly protein PilO
MIPILKQFNLEQLVSDKKKLMLTGVICLIVIFIDVSFVMKLQLAGLSAQGPKITKLKADIDKLSADLAKMQSIQGKDSKKQAGVVLQKKLISEGQITTLLQNISETAKKNGVRISQIRQAPEVVSAKLATSFIPYLISLDFTADYHTLGRFLNQLENGDIFIAVQDLRISPGTQNEISQSCFVTLKTYVKR